ncbi:nicolin-1-like [Styela clava]
MSTKPIICTFKSPQVINIGGSDINSGCSVIDVTFPNMGVVDIGSVTFRNNYTAYVSIMCKIKKTIKGGETTTIWKRAMKKMKLMPNPHSENCSQSFFSIASSRFRFSLEYVAVLRILMRQPSPCWKSFGLDEIKLFPPPAVQELSTAIPRWLLAGDSPRIGMDENEPIPKEQARIAGLPDPDELSKRLHQLWGLSEKSSEAGAITNDSPVGRFDIDGCYEINLLSYG